jgi:phage terminase Nu1 subunit (DNA packaging protein)
LIPDVVKTVELCKLLDVSKTKLAELKSAGIVVPVDGVRGHFKAIESMHGYIDHLRKRKAGQGTTHNLADERAKTEKVEREMKEMRLAEMQGQVLKVGEVTASWSAFGQLVRQKVMGLPSKFRQAVPHLTSHDAEMMREQCRELLQDLAVEAEDAVIGATGDGLNAAE